MSPTRYSDESYGTWTKIGTAGKVKLDVDKYSMFLFVGTGCHNYHIVTTQEILGMFKANAGAYNYRFIVWAGQYDGRYSYNYGSCCYITKTGTNTFQAENYGFMYGESADIYGFAAKA